MNIEAEFPTQFRGEMVTVKMRGEIYADGRTVLDVHFLKDGVVFMPRPIPTRAELAALCRQAAALCRPPHG